MAFHRGVFGSDREAGMWYLLDNRKVHTGILYHRGGAGEAKGLRDRVQVSESILRCVSPLS